MKLVFPMLLLLVSGGLAVAMIARKWRQLTLLDVENIPAVKEARKKNELLRKKLDTLALSAQARRMAEWWLPLGEKFRSIQRRFRAYVHSVEQRIQNEAKRLRVKESPEKKQARAGEVRKFISDGEFALVQGDAETAEKRFLSAIRLDSRNPEAYRGLAEVYIKQGHLEEAMETYKFLLKLIPADDKVYVQLADLSEQMGNGEQAVQYLQQAVLINDSLSTRFARLSTLLADLGEYQTALESAKQAAELEPQNPKYLDSLIELAILAADRETAETAWQALRMVNPDNQKLPALKEKIESM